MMKNLTSNHSGSTWTKRNFMARPSFTMFVAGFAACASAQANSEEGWTSAESRSLAAAPDSYSATSGWRTATAPRPEALLDLIAVRLAEAPGASGMSVAISDFEAAGGSDCGFHDFVGETLTTRLVNSTRFRAVAERRLLNKVLKEHNLQSGTFLVNPTSRKKVGRLLGADAIVAGVFSDMGDAVSISARLIDVETGTVVAATQVSLPRDASVDRLLCGSGALVGNTSPRSGAGNRRGLASREGGSTSCDSLQPWVGYVNIEGHFSGMPSNTYVNMGFSYGSNIWVETELDGRPLPLCGQKQTVEAEGRTVDLAPPQSRVRAVIEQPGVRMQLVRRCWAFNPVTGKYTRYGTGDYDNVSGGYDGTAWSCSFGR
jgi:curli biogenesis system outer membrane secretion channel CsgG